MSLEDTRPMRYTTFKCGPWPNANLFAKTLTRLMPRANPDFELAYEKIVTWWLEIDDNNIVQRELGFDDMGTPLVAAPLGDNHGIFTDLDSAPEGLGADIEHTTFEQTWQEFTRKWLSANGQHVI